MQKTSSDIPGPKGPGKAVKYVLMAFVGVSILAATVKIAAPPCCDKNEAENVPAAAMVSAEPAAVAVKLPQKPSPAKERGMPAVQAAKQTSEGASAKIAVVYYFYTTARCYSCNLIEAYTREAVATRFAQSYNGWRVEFKDVNVDLPENKHFIQDYWLNSKSVVVQKFEGEKPLNWALLKSVWQLLGDKEKFMDYVAAETRKVVDSK